MRKFFCILAAIFLFLSCTEKKAGSSNSDMAAVFTAAKLPLLRQTVSARDFTLSLLPAAGETGDAKTTLSDLKGKVVFLNFWATWCPPCREEMPSMNSLYNRYKDKGFEMLAVNGMEAAQTVSDFRDAFNLVFPILLDSDGKVTSSYGVQAIPSTFLINREGQIVVRFVGSIDWDTPAVHKALEKLLDS